MSKEKLIQSLNEDLAGELSAIIQYITYAAKATGPYRPQLSQFFLTEVADEQLHAQFLANKIVALGGEPTTRPAEVRLSVDNREMLELALQAERETIERYTRRIDQAEEAGEIGLRVDLEDIVSDETKHKEDLEQILTRWSD